MFAADYETKGEGLCDNERFIGKEVECIQAAKDLQIDYSGTKSSTSSIGGCYRDSSKKSFISFNKNLDSSPDQDSLNMLSQNAVCRKGKLNDSFKLRYI